MKKMEEEEAKEKKEERFDLLKKNLGAEAGARIRMKAACKTCRDISAHHVAQFLQRYMNGARVEVNIKMSGCKEKTAVSSAAESGAKGGGTMYDGFLP